MSYPVISCCIPAKDENDPLLKDLIVSIKAQDYPQDKIEIIVETRGDSESAKAMAIRRATGDIICMLCTDNMFMDKYIFLAVSNIFSLDKEISAIYPRMYFYKPDDNSLNRYFSLIGGNDPVCYYLGKNDRWPWDWDLRKRCDYQSSYGCNGFFYRANLIKATDLDHYYPMDNALEVKGIFYPLDSHFVWHRTADGFLTFFKKRYKYARDLYCDRQDRRWKMLDTREDHWKLAGFVLATVTVLPCLMVSIRGWLKIKDWAWFWHWPVCLGTLITYGVLVCRNLLKYRSLSQLFSVRRASSHV